MGDASLLGAGSFSQWDLGLGVVLALALYVGVMGAALHRARSHTPRHILRRLDQTGRPFTVRVGFVTGTWDPSRPAGSANRLFRRGFATYWLTDDGRVHLKVHQADGTMLRYEGPVPEWFHSPTPAQLRRHQLVRMLLAGYVLFAVIGFALGWVVAGGPVGHRAAGGLVGLLGATAVTAVGSQAWLVGHSVTGLRSRRGTTARQSNERRP